MMFDRYDRLGQIHYHMESAYPFFEGLMFESLPTVNRGMRIGRLAERLKNEVGISVPDDFFKYVVMNDEAIFKSIVAGQYQVKIIFRNISKEELIGTFVIGLHSFITKYNGIYSCNEKCEIIFNKTNMGVKLIRGDIAVHLNENDMKILKGLLDFCGDDRRVIQLKNTFFTRRGY